jgi:lipopolysaccharide export LptBFGC system permease protein LptF
VIFTVVTFAVFVMAVIAAVFGFGPDFGSQSEFRITFFFLIGAFLLTFFLGILWKRQPPPPL